MIKKINTLFWNEGEHEKKDEVVRNIYPNGLHAPIVDMLNKEDDIKATFATLAMRPRELKYRSACHQRLAQYDRARIGAEPDNQDPYADLSEWRVWV